MLGLLARAGALQYKHVGLFQPARAQVQGYKDTRLTDIKTAHYIPEPANHHQICGVVSLTLHAGL